MKQLLCAFACLCIVLVSGCAQPGSSVTPALAERPATSPDAAAASSHIKHVVIIVQENRSFDNFFNGFPGTDTRRYGYDHTGKRIPLKEVRLSEMGDVNHLHGAWVKAYNHGKMNGFDLQMPNGIPMYGAYQYVNPADLQPYWTMARHFTIADHMFQSNSGPTFPAHQYLIAGQSGNVKSNDTGAADNPSSGTGTAQWGCDGPSGERVAIYGPDPSNDKVAMRVGSAPPCFDYLTMADLLDNAQRTWRYYEPCLEYGGGTTGPGDCNPADPDGGREYDAFDAIRHIRYGPDWDKHVISPETRILRDIPVQGLASVTWVVPRFANSDHRPAHVIKMAGPQWVASVVNAIGKSKAWSSTAIFIVWDDWGGNYDHVRPPQVDFMGDGFRVPLIVISPYAKHGYVSHVTHEFGSILHFTEEVFGLPSLGTRDVTSDDLMDCFNFKQKVRPLNPIPSSLGASYFLHDPAPDLSPDND